MSETSGKDAMSELSDFGRLRFATGATSPESDEDAADMSVKRMRRATKYDDGDSSMNGARGDGKNRGSERRAALNGGERTRKCQARRLFAPRCTEESEAFKGDLRAKREPEGRASGCAEHSLFR